MSIIPLRFLYFYLFILSPIASYASDINTETLPRPSGQVILSISGTIDKINTADRRVEFDLAMLEKFPQISLNTTTRWTDGLQSFIGVAVSDLLEYVSAKGQKIDATAMDGYTASSLNVADMKKYQVILAYKRNGNYMRIRDKGPLWMMYPVDDYPELQNDISTQYKLIWHLRNLHIK